MKWKLCTKEMALNKESKIWGSETIPALFTPRRLKYKFELFCSLSLALFLSQDGTFFLQFLCKFRRIPYHKCFLTHAYRIFSLRYTVMYIYTCVHVPFVFVSLSLFPSHILTSIIACSALRFSYANNPTQHNDIKSFFFVRMLLNRRSSVEFSDVPVCLLCELFVI